MHWWRDNRGKVIATLGALWIGSLLRHFEITHLVLPILAIACSAVFDYILSAVVTESSFVTGLLIGLLSGNIPVAIAACVGASFSKRFLGKGPHRHVFNPAAFGVLSASILMSQPVAWWGAAWGIIPVVIIGVGMTLTLLRLRRFWMTALFLIVYVTVTRSVQLTIDGTVFLFAFIMLVDPITSTSGKIWKYGWGLLVGGLVAVQIVLVKSAVDPLLAVLLCANAVAYIFLRA